MTRTRLALLTLIGALIIAAVALDVGELLSLDAFKMRQAQIADFVDARPWAAAFGFLGIYVAVTAANLPGATAMTIIAGAVFGLLHGTIIVSFASSIGATLGFLFSRYLLRDFVESRFAGVARTVNRGIEKEGGFYLFTLRLVPLFPFFAINLGMGLTRLSAVTFYWVSQIGMLAGTLVYVNAGTQVATLESPAGLLSPRLIGAFALLGIFPLVARRIVAAVRRRHGRPAFRKPKKWDTNLVVIGGGSAGLVSAYVAAASKARVTLIERDAMGGDCLNTGCVPSKALIRAGRIASLARGAGGFGVDAGPVSVDFPRVMSRVRHVIAQIEPHDSVERYTSLGVDCLKGDARFISPWEIQVGEQVIRSPATIIATGGQPVVPPIDGLADANHVTSDTIWELDSLPARLLVVGGGAIGCELGQAFSRLGSEVTIVDLLPRLVANEDVEVSDALRSQLESEGIRILTERKVTGFTRDGDHGTAHVEGAGSSENLLFDVVLVAVGRCAVTEGLGLDSIGIGTSESGHVTVDNHLRTVWPNIFACGDVAGPYQLTHAASHQAWYCAMNALFGRFWRFRPDYSALPHAVFTEPEIARVGLSETEANRKGTEYELTTYDLADSDRAIADGSDTGFIRVLTVPGKDRILGATVVGAQAGELIAEFTLAMRHGLGLGKILGTIHPYPTLMEANKAAAGAWQRAHLPSSLLKFAARLHAWRL